MPGVDTGSAASDGETVTGPAAPVVGAHAHEHVRKRGEPLVPFGTPIEVPKWAMGEGDRSLLTRDALEVALASVPRGGKYALCCDGRDHQLVYRNLSHSKRGPPGYRVTCRPGCAISLIVRMVFGGELARTFVPEPCCLQAPGKADPTSTPVLAPPPLPPTTRAPLPT